MSTDTYSGNGSQVDFTITFPYLSRDFVVVSVGGVPQVLSTNYTYISPTVVRFNVAPPAATDNVTLQRVTSDNPLVDFVNGSGINEVDLDTATQQSVHIAQESRSEFDDLSTSVTNSFVAVEGDITALEGDVSTAQSDITTLQGDVTATEGDITTLQGTVSNHGGRLTTAENTLAATVVTQGDQGGELDIHDTDIEALQLSEVLQDISINDFESRLNTLETGSSASAVEARVVTLESEMDVVEADIALIEPQLPFGLQNVAALTTTLVIPAAQNDVGHAVVGLTGTLDLRNISGGFMGQLVTLFWRTGGTSTVINQAGGSQAIVTADGQPISPTIGKCVTFISNGSTWFEVSRTDVASRANELAIDVLQADMTATEGATSTNAADISVLEGEMAAVEADVATLQGDMTAVESDVADNAADIVTLQGESVGATFDITGLDTFDIPIAVTSTTYGSIAARLERKLTTTVSTNGDSEHIIGPFTGSSSGYRVELYYMRPVNFNAHLYMTFSIDNGVTYENSGYQYRLNAWDSANGNDAAVDNSGSFIQIQRRASNSFTAGVYELYISMPNNSFGRTVVRGNGSGITTFGTDALQTLELAAGLRSSTRITHIKLAYSAGNIQNMSSQLYGKLT